MSQDLGDALDDRCHRLCHIGSAVAARYDGCSGGGRASLPSTVRSWTPWSRASLVWNVK